MTSATVDQSPDEHRWQFNGHRVTQLMIDLGSFRFQSWALDASAEVRCGVPFTFREVGGRSLTIDPEHPEQLAPLLTLLGRSIDTLRVHRSGELAVAFGDGSVLFVSPHPRFEAWEVRGGGALEGLDYLCDVGGGSPWG